jgi:hypothetical protein
MTIEQEIEWSRKNGYGDEDWFYLLNNLRWLRDNWPASPPCTGSKWCAFSKRIRRFILEDILPKYETKNNSMAS